MRASVESRSIEQFPKIIQGGMGVAVSDWRLAGAVAGEGEMGIVSGTAIGVVMARRLQDGDQDGSLRDALAAFPDPEIAERILQRYYIPDGRRPGTPYVREVTLDGRNMKEPTDLNMAGAFAEVWLAKRRAAQLAEARGEQPGPVGINLLTKVQAPNISAIFGAMLAGVDGVVMGAGIPTEIPRVIRDLAQGDPASLRLDVTGSHLPHMITVDQAAYPALAEAARSHPAFLAIITSDALGKMLLSRGEVPPDGFVIERPTAGGHNAPPRKKGVFDDEGQPVYDPIRDEANLGRMRDLGRPFWLAGSYGTPEDLLAARAEGAQGIQVGTAFALCTDSGMSKDLRQKLVERALSGDLRVRTDPLASPTGFPFKVPAVPHTLSEEEVYADRGRICDLGYLREAYVAGVVTDDSGKVTKERVGYRCASEPVEDFVRKGGKLEETIGRKCLCNGLLATAGHPQLRPNGVSEPPILTIGDHAAEVARRLNEYVGSREFSAAAVIRFLRGVPA